ncbi:MAG: amidohydrolase, partial [Anaerovoracaceae bacterium]
ISTEIPVVLERVCGHAISVNSKVIELLGLTEDSPQVPGGQFLKGEDGKLNGIFTENAGNEALRLFPPATKEEMQEAMESAMDYAVSHGLTSVQSNDAGTSFGGYENFFSMMHEIYDGNQAKVRYRHQLSFKDTETYKEFLEGEYLDSRYGGDSWLTMGPLKLFKDGSLGARTAYMKNGYVGEPDNHGVDCISKEEMTEFCLLAREHGMQVATHAIGDAACEETIDCYEKSFVDGENKLRHALVHCQITDRGILDRIVEKDIYVMAQPIFIDYDMTILEKLCGPELAATSYNFGTLLREGAHLSYGTDCPVEDCNPFDNLYMAVTRKDRNGNPEGGFFPSECVDVETAVDAYTLESARNEFQEDRKGRLKPGYYADLVVLDRDIFTVDPMEIREILPVMTMVGGKIVYSR